ncbi:hypothetical protein PF007_g23126 [Phytophthora fragariae]|uniref:Integrase catalytic domain-containing protein n=1 Tax=Phytophthora fragariae TaxID=53985 RepID=A0A6A3U119_9STRA|nr:hypothetical protein PF003_g5534 [Phytophthora fragariae]KAE8926124.1 hypothetical protein PF009_g23681 [Phytophthora fragariae]KAE9080238.1 hypothetical protein PF007_g23126 [Phytophthora fragariae]KAE9144694.1 hypothetical protein PF006_g10391 [Phytophthora fragariae]
MYAIDTFDTPRVVIPADDDFRARLVHEYHDAPAGGHLGREKTFAALSRDFFWPRMYKWIRKLVRSCEICQRVRPAASKQAPLRPIPVATNAWRSVSMDFIFGLPRDAEGRTGVLVFVDRFSKMVHLAPVTADESAELFLDLVFRHHGLPESIVSDREPRFTSAFWPRLFALLGTRLLMSTAAHPETDGQTERVNRVLEDVLRSYATSFASWSSFLPMAEFALNNSTHASTELTPFFVNNTRAFRLCWPSEVRMQQRSPLLVGEEWHRHRSRRRIRANPRCPSRPSPTLETPQSRATLFTAWHTRTSSQLMWLRPPRPPSLTSPRQQTRRRSTLQQCPSSSCTAKPSRGLCVTRSKSLWIDRKPTQIDGAGRTCRPSGEASDYFYLRKAPKALQ